VNLAEKIVMRPIGALIPYASNARTHSDAQIAQIAGSIREFGFTNPVLVDGKQGIIAGHGRVLAARKLGMDQIPTIELAYLSETQRQAYIIADNKLAENAGWDAEMLRLELGDLKSLGFDLTLTGFDDVELGALFADKTAGLTDPDDTPPVPEHPVSQTGDLWLLGRHRLLCGDSTVATDVERALGGVEPHLMVTDPPYGVGYDAMWRGKAGHATKGKNRSGHVFNDDRADWREVWSLFPGSIVYCWHGALTARLVAESLESCDSVIRSQIIWNKTTMTMGRGDYHWKHEPCWYAVKGTGNWQGDRKQTTVWDIASPIHIMSGSKEVKTEHPTQKPVECMRRPIENNSSPGQAVYEPFSGSGTTIIASEMTGRSCHAIEVSASYIDVAVKRWQDFAGKEATLDGDGRTFDQIAAERQPQAAGKSMPRER
jgi:DNA modification methylase